MEQPIEVTTETPQPASQNESTSGKCQRTAAEWLDFSFSLPVISLIVIAIIHWDDCSVLPSLNEYLVTFAPTVIAMSAIRFIFRTEKLKREGGPMWPWVHVETFLDFTLLGLSIWGATLTFGNFDLMGDECHPSMFIAALVSAIITFVIFAAVFVYIVYMIVVEIRKELRNEEASQDDPQDEAHRSENPKEETQVVLEMNLSLAVISLIVIAIIHWDDCSVIPSLNAYLVTFAPTVIARSAIRLIFRTEKLKREGGPMWPWVHVETFLDITLLGLSIWGAALTFGSFDLKGEGEDECHPAMFFAAFTSVAIAFVIFAAIFVYKIYLFVVESRKEQNKKAKEESGDAPQDKEHSENPKGEESQFSLEIP